MKEMDFTDDELNMYLAFNETVMEMLIDAYDYELTEQFLNKVNHLATSMVWQKKLDLNIKEMIMDDFKNMIESLVNCINDNPYKFKMYFDNYEVTDGYKKPCFV